MTTVAPEHDLLSVNKLAELLQATPAAIERAAQRARIVPALRLNGQAWFADATIAAIRKELAKCTRVRAKRTAGGGGL